MASEENPIRKVFEAKPMKTTIEGTNEKLGRCLLAKTEKSAQLDTKKAFTIIAEQIAYIVGSLLSYFKSNVAWFSSPPIYMQNMHLYHVCEDDSYVENM